jgi:hypothetical protein
MSPNPPRRHQHDDDSDHEIESMKQCLQARVFVPLLTELLAYKR